MFRELISAEAVRAVYNESTKKLTLYANGRVRTYIKGINFDDDVILGGLKYGLYGWAQMPGPGLDRDYKHQQDFDIFSIQVAAPSGYVTVVTSNKEWKVKIEYIVWDAQGNPTPAPAPEAVATPETAVQTLSGEATRMTVLFREEFRIQTRFVDTPGSSVKISYSQQNLVMTNASGESGQLIWKFNSLETGPTPISVYTFDSVKTVVYKKDYIINVVVLDPVVDPVLPPTELAPAQILKFIGRVFIAQRIVTKTYPNAKLIRVDAEEQQPIPYPVDDPNLLSKLKVLFSNGDKGSVSIESRGWSDFYPPVPGPPVVGLQEFDITKCHDITDAAKAMQAAGYTESFWSCTLSQQLTAPPMPDEPSYAFQMVDTSTVSVGSFTLTVHGPKDGNISGKTVPTYGAAPPA